MASSGTMGWEPSLWLGSSRASHEPNRSRRLTLPWKVIRSSSPASRTRSRQRAA